MNKMFRRIEDGFEYHFGSCVFTFIGAVLSFITTFVATRAIVVDNGLTPVEVLIAGSPFFALLALGLFLAYRNGRDS